MKKKIIQISSLSVAVIIAAALLAFGVLQLVQKKNVAKTGNVLGVSWYNENDKEFVITTAKELNEFAKLSTFYDFKDQTIKLGADIVLNEGDATEWAKSAPENRWTPISNFAGIFDGQGHRISGMYGTAFEAKMAMFTDTAYTCTIKDLQLVNSYFKTRGHRGTASFVSNGAGKFLQLYSDAIIDHIGENAAGLVSKIKKQTTFEECWFDGIINISSRDCGGIVDEIDGARVSISHCLFSGKINTSYDFGGTRTGGICGVVNNGGALLLDDCLVSGNITAAKNIYTGSLIGATYAGVDVTTTDSYVSSNVYENLIGASGSKGKFNGSALVMGINELTGVKAYQWTTLDFEQYWSAVTEDTPVLSCFSEEALSLDGVAKEYDISWYNSNKFSFELTTREQLFGFYIVSASDNFSNKTVKLGADIIINEGDAKKWATVAPKYAWSPISKYAGIFDGQGHTISGIYIKTDSTYQGFFSSTTDTAVLKNFSIKNSYFECTNETNAFMGSVTGELYGNMENVYSNAIVVSTGDQVGGLIGRANDNDSNGKEDAVDIINCWFDGALTMRTTTEEPSNLGAIDGGGIVGRVVQGDCNIEHCLNTGTITSELVAIGLHVGGIVGSARNAGVLNIKDTLNVGVLNADYKVCIGSIIGRYTGDVRTVNLTDVYTTTESWGKAVSTNSNKGVLNGGVLALPESQLSGTGGYRYTTLDFEKYWTAQDHDTPILKQYASKTLNVAGIKRMIDMSWYKTDAAEYVLDSAQDLYTFAVLSRSNNFKGKTVKLGTDITLNKVDESILEAWANGTAAPETEWIPIGTSTAFAGTFDGQGHTISGVYLNTDESYGGLFGIVSPTAVIQNLKLTSSYIAYSGPSLTEEGKEVNANIGSICGDMRGDMFHVYSNAIVTSTAARVGGLAGIANGAKDSNGKLTTSTISDCWFDGEVKLTGPYARYAGGIAGIAMQGTIEITNCLNSGTVSNERDNAGQFIGGILGREWAANTVVNITDTVNTGSVKAKYYNCVGSVVGRINNDTSVYTIKNTYATKESCVYTNEKIVTIGGSIAGKLNGGAFLLEEEQLTGYNAYKYANSLDFGKIWTVAINPESTLALQSFVPKVDVSGLEKEVDITWYDEKVTKQEIDSRADLYGLAMLSTVYNLEGKQFFLKADIEVNRVSADVLASWKTDSPIALTPEWEWLPIGAIGNNIQPAAKAFAGIFDGQGHKISGVYMNTEVSYTGLFGATSPTSVLTDFRLVDSYFEYSGLGYIDDDTAVAKDSSEAEVHAAIGSVAGDLRGDMKWVYSNSFVVSSGNRAGGLVGITNGAKGTDGKLTTSTIEECWSEANVRLNGNGVRLDGVITEDDTLKAKYGARYAGGIAGIAMQGTIEIKHCLFTGSVSNIRNNGGQFIGGIFGEENNACTVQVTDTLLDGTISVVYNNCVGTAIGRTNKSGSTYKFDNVYATSFHGKTIGNTGSAKTEGAVSVKDESVLKGTASFRVNLLDKRFWVARRNEIPGPIHFVGSVIPANMVMNVEGLVNGETDWYSEDADKLYIESPEDMYGFMALLNQNETFAGQTIYLTKDIAMNPAGSVTSYVESGKDITKQPVNEWIPSGNDTASTQFAGTFDGQGHTISGIYVETEADHVGLFGATAIGSIVTDFYLKDSYFYTTAANANMGSIAGQGRGVFSKVYSEAVVEGTGSRIGGLLGSANGTSSNATVVLDTCWFAGSVRMTGEAAQFGGGLIGLVMQGDMEILHCLVTGSVSSNSTNTKAGIGGAIGVLGYATSNAMTFEMMDTVVALKQDMKDTVALAGRVGAVIGTINAQNSSSTKAWTYKITDSYATAESYSYKNENVYVPIGHKGTTPTGAIVVDVATALHGTAASLDYNVCWTASDSALPSLKYFNNPSTVSENAAWYFKYAGSEDDPYQISKEAELREMGNMVNSGVSFRYRYFVLTANIKMNEGWTVEVDESYNLKNKPSNLTKWTPIGDYNNKFLGNLDGRGKTISGLYVDTNTQYAGLFGYAGDAGNGSIKNLQMINSYVKGKCTSGDLQAGSVAGSFGGSTIGNIYSEAYIVGEATTGKLVEIGGLVGRINGSGNHRIDTCWFAGNVIQPTVISKAGSILGGIAARSNAGTNTIINCLNTGNVLNYFDKTSASGTENKNQLVKMGGILGTQTSSGDITINKCLNLGTVCALNHQFTGTTSERGAGPIVGTFSTDVIVNNTLWINVEHFDDKKNDDLCYGCDSAGNVEDKIANGSITLDANSKQYADENALIAAIKAQETSAMVLGFGNTGEWMSVTINDNGTAVDMTPILKDFATWWLDYKKLVLYTQQ